MKVEMISLRERYAVVLLIAVAVGSTIFLRSEPTRNPTTSDRPAFTAQDDYIMRVAARRDETALLSVLRTGQISPNYAVGGVMDMYTIATSRKLPELLAYLLELEGGEVSQMAHSFVFLRDDDHVEDSIAIKRMHLAHKYTGVEASLDTNDAVGVLMIMCSMGPYAPSEVDRILDGFDIRAPANLIEEAARLQASDTRKKEGADECLEQVLQHVTAVPA